MSISQSSLWTPAVASLGAAAVVLLTLAAISTVGTQPSTATIGMLTTLAVTAVSGIVAHRRRRAGVAANLYLAVLAVLLLSEAATQTQPTLTAMWLVPVPALAFSFCSRRSAWAWSIATLLAATLLGFSSTITAAVPTLGPLRAIRAIGWLVAVVGIAAAVRRSFSGAIGALSREVRIRRDAEQAARAASLAKTRLLGNLSHELRTPLVGVIGMSRFLMERDAHPDVRQPARIIDESGQLLLGLVDDLLDYASLSSGRLRIRRLDVDLHRHVESVVALMRGRAQAKGLELRLHEDPDLPAWVVLDPLRLRQILINLLGNAIKFTNVGHVELRIRRAGDQLRVEVEDTGVGIVEGEREQIFEPFHQIDSTASRHFGGTGLGLSICRRLIEAMDGAIGVDSERGRGTTFWFLLPLVEGTAPAQRQGPTLEHRDGARILAVDDNDINLVVTTTQLESLGFDVQAVSSGSKALKQLAREPFDLVFMDCQMPGLDGYETTRRLRLGEGPNQQVPVIALTAHAIWPERQRCLESGMDDYLTKPVDLDRLAETAARWLNSMDLMRSPSSDSDGRPVGEAEAS
ncbi:MAG: ATP-binding protein [Acidobacteriota bacterium]